MDTIMEAGKNSDELVVALVGKYTIPMIEDALKRLMLKHPAGLTEYASLDGIMKALVENDLYDLWVGVEDGEIEIAMICAKELHDKQSFYHIVWLGGKNFKKYKKVGVEILNHYLALKNFTYLTFSSLRKGFARELKPLGFVPAPMKMIKYIETGNETMN